MTAGVSPHPNSDRGDCAITTTEWLRIESPQRCDVAGVGAMWNELARARRFLWRAQLCGRRTTAPPPHLRGQARQPGCFQNVKNIDATPSLHSDTATQIHLAAYCPSNQGKPNPSRQPRKKKPFWGSKGEGASAYVALAPKRVVLHQSSSWCDLKSACLRAEDPRQRRVR